MGSPTVMAVIPMSGEQFSTHYCTGIEATRAFLISKCSLKWERAHELSQKAWVRAWEKRHQYTGRDKKGNPVGFQSWVNVIALNYYRREYRYKDKVVFTDSLPEHGAGDLEGELANSEWVGRAMRRLKPGDRELLRARYWMGLKRRQVAVLMGVRAENVGVKTWRAEQKLKASLEAFGQVAARQEMV